MCGIHFIWVFKSMYVDNGTEKVQRSAKSRTRVKISTSEILNPPISDNNYFYFSICFFIRILDILNCHYSRYISCVVISRILLVPYTLGARIFSWYLKISFFPLDFPMLVLLKTINWYHIIGNSGKEHSF